MNLPVPIFSENIYDVIEYTKPKNKVITKAYEVAEKGNLFHAILELIAGCTVSLMSIDGDIIDSPGQIKKLIGAMPYMSAEVVGMKILATLNDNDVIEGMYVCPRCSTKVISEYDPELEIDTRDRVSDLPVICMEKNEYDNEIIINLDDPVRFMNKRTGEQIETVNNFSIRYPTLNDCIIAGRNMQPGHEARVQLQLYTQAMIKVNGEEVKKNWVSVWGKMLFDEMYTADINKLGDAMQKYGLKKELEKMCHNCGKVWYPPVNTSNFFALGLRPA